MLLGTFLSDLRLSSKVGNQSLSLKLFYTRRHRLMKLCSRVMAVVFLLTLTAAAQEPKQTPQASARTVVLDIDIIDLNPEQRGEFEKIIRDKRAVDRLISDGKARPIAGIQVRARSGQPASRAWASACQCKHRLRPRVRLRFNTKT